MVLCVDEESRIQALNRTRMALPLGPAYAEGFTHFLLLHRDTMRTFSSQVFLGAFLSMVMLLFGSPAEAQTTTEVLRVSNSGRDNSSARLIFAHWDFMQGFTTGPNSSDWELASIALNLTEVPNSGSGLRAWVLSAADNGSPGTSTVCDLDNPSPLTTGYPKFTATDCVLQENTQYFVALTYTGSGDRPYWQLTSSNSESTRSEGWSINDRAHARPSGGSNNHYSEASQKVRIYVFNNAPASADRTVSIDEDTAYTFEVSDFDFTDIDGDTLTHVEITSLPGTNEGKLSFDGADVTDTARLEEVTKAHLNAGQLTYTPPLNASGVDFTTFNFKVSDGFDVSTNAYSMKMNVMAVDDPPVVSGNETPDYEENGTAAVSSYLATDAEGATIAWSVSGPDSDDFSIDSDNGVLTFKSAPDYENPGDVNGDNEYLVTVEASDGALTGTVNVTVTVTDAPVISGPTATSYIEDGMEAVGTYTAGGSVTWDLSGPDSDEFSIDSGGILSFNASPDFESPTDANSDNMYTVTVEATDGGETGALDVAVTVTANDPPVVSGSASPDYEENGTAAVGSYLATDPQGDAITWSLTGEDRSAFNISDGVLSFINSPDYDVPADADRNNVYEVTVEAFDGTVTGTLDVTVTVTANADLSALGISEVTLNEPFASETTRYTATVTHSVSHVTVTATPADSSATVTMTVDGTEVNDGTVPLKAGAVTTIRVAIAHGNVHKIHTIEIIRSAPARVKSGASATTSDEVRPTVTMQMGAPAPVGGAFEVTIAFSEEVTGFERSEITVTNGSVTRFGGLGRSYAVEITPSESGEVRVEVGADVAEDRAGNGNLAAELLVIEADLTRPEVEITSEATGPVSGAFEVMIRFSEPVTSFKRSEITVTNGSVISFGGSGRSYKVEITPSGSGEVRVEVGADAARDGAGNGNRAAAPFVIEADLTGPEVEITSEATGPVSGAFKVTITFSEEVMGFEGSDIQVTNGTVSDFGGPGSSYTVEITPSGSGEVRVEVGADAARDGAGNGNRATAPFIIEADLTPPEVEITSQSTGRMGAAFEVAITFSEPVTGFEGSAMRISNGKVMEFSEVSANEYRATIEPAVAGQPVVVEVPEDMAKDEVGNGNRAAAPFMMETAIEVSYAAESYTAAEGGEAVTVTVRLSLTGAGGLAIPIRVTRPETTEAGDYRVEGLEGWDAQEGAGRLSFPAGEKERIWRIAANHDGDGDDETVELGFGELPEIAMAGEPSVATVRLEDKGLVELEVRFAQAAYEVKEGEGAAIEVSVSPAADRRVEVPLLVALRGGTTAEDYRGVPASVVFGEGERAGTISVEVLADGVSDSGEGIVLSFGALPEGVVAGDPSSTEVGFGQQRTAEQFTPSLEGMLAVMARSLGESAQTAIEGRFARYRQWSRLGSSDGALEPRAPGTDEAVSGSAPTSDRSGPVSRGEPSGFDVGGAEGDLGGGDSRVAEDTLRAVGRTLPAMEPSGAAAGDPGGSWPGGSWLRRVLRGSLGRLARFDQLPGDAAAGSGIGRSRNGYGEAGLRSVGGGAPESAGYSALLSRAFNLSGASFEMPLGQRARETSWAPAFWGRGDLQQFDGDLGHLGMNYRGGLNAAHVGLDLYANERMLAGLSFMRSWGDLDYTDDGVDGVLESGMNTVHPYVYWQPGARVSVWGIGGLGRGQVDVTEPGRTHDFGADFRMFAGGVRAALLRRGGNEWSVRADAFTTRLETGAAADIAKVGGEAQRGRTMLEWVHDRTLSVGRSLSLKGEAGGRFDRGAADMGAGLETGFRLGYLDANQGLDVAVQGRVLLVHESDYRDWGVGVQASWDPGKKQRGFRASATSSWGRDGGGRTTLWDNADAVLRPAGMGAMGPGSRYRLESEVAYAGLRTPGLPGPLTPYSRLRWVARGRELALGAEWSVTRSQQAVPWRLELEAMRRENRTDPADLALLLRMSIPF